MADDKLYLQFAIKKDGDNGINDIIKETEKLQKRIHDHYPIKLKFTTDGALKDLNAIQAKLDSIKTTAKGITIKVNEKKIGSASKATKVKMPNAGGDEDSDKFYKKQIDQLNKLPAKYAAVVKSIQKYRKEWALLAKDTQSAKNGILSDKSSYSNGKVTGNINDLTRNARAQFDNLNKLFDEQKQTYQKAEAVATTMTKSYNAYVKTVGRDGHILNKEQYQQYMGNYFDETMTLRKNPSKLVRNTSFDLFSSLGDDATEAFKIFDSVIASQKNLNNEFLPVKHINDADLAYKKLSHSIKDFIDVNEASLTKVGAKSQFETLLKQVDSKEIKNLTDAKRKFEELKVDNKQRQQTFGIEQKNLGVLNKLPSQYEAASKAIQKYRQESKMLIKTYEMDSARLLRDSQMYTGGKATGNTADLNSGGSRQYDQIQKDIKNRKDALMQQEELFARMSRIQKAREMALNGKDSFTNVVDINRFKQTLKDNFGEQEGTNIFESLTKDAKGLSEEISRLNTNKNKLETLTKEFKQIRGDDIKFGSLSSTMSDYIQDYQKALKSAKLLDQATTLQGRVNTRDFPDFKTAAAEVENFKMQARLAGVESDKFLGKFDKTLGARLRSALAGNAVFYAQDAFRQMYNNVKEVDAAMTELKKVTDETADTYDRFLSNAASRAQEIGASLVETIQATADYARLGYNINDATQLADSALVYRNVGDDIKSMEDASASLISTMQGFHIEAQDSMSIVDKFNEVDITCLLTQ